MTAHSDIVIAGIGLASPAGASSESTWASLLDGDVIADHARAITPSPRGGEGAGNRLVDLGELVGEEAIGHAAWNSSHLADPRTALIIGTSKGPADDWLLPIDDTFDSPTSDKPSNPECEDVTPGKSLTVNRSVAIETSITIDPPRPITSPGTLRNPLIEPGLHTISSELAIRLNLGTGPRLTYSAACASSLHALVRAAMMIENDEIDRAIVITTESSLHPAFIQSFRRLGVLATPGEPCRPFDRNRSGFLIAEAAAAICLERRPAMAGEIVLDGYGIGADASHLTSTDANAVALKRCLARVIAGGPVDLVHAHATGTIANDPIELAAIESTVGGSRPILYSHKGSIGHSLGASGLIAAVLNVICHRQGVVPGNVTTTDPLPTRAGRIEQQPVKHPIRRSVAIAAGFGGATAVVGLRTA